VRRVGITRCAVRWRANESLAGYPKAITEYGLSRVIPGVNRTISWILAPIRRFNCDVLPRVEKVADLGKIVSKNLVFSDYINECTSKAFSRSFLIFKGFSPRNSLLLVKSFTTYVRPLLEYNTYIWSPHDVYNITKIESVQRRFTKRFPSVSHLSYSERLEFLRLESLEYRRLIADPDTVDFTSLCTFKHTIKLADLSPFLKASMS